MENPQITGEKHPVPSAAPSLRDKKGKYSPASHQKHTLNDVFFSFRNTQKKKSTHKSDSDTADETDPESDCDSESLFFGDENEFDEYSWLTSLIGVAKNSKEVEVGRVIAHLINRPRMRATFHSDMDEPSEELQNFGWTLFDKRGYFKGEHYKHEVNRGSGVWGEELGNGTFLYIEYISVSPKWRKIGVGTNLVKGMQELAAEEGCPYIFVWPCALSTSPEISDTAIKESRLAAYNAQAAITLALFHKLGFRRVGRTQYLCHALDKNHPSHKLDAANDAKEHEASMEPASGSASGKEFPLHAALITSADAGVAKMLKTPGQLPANFDFTAKDYSGNTPVHLAAYTSKFESLKLLLGRPCGQECLKQRNILGLTPLESLQLKLTEDREFLDCFSRSSTARGCTADQLRCLRELKKRMGLLEGMSQQALRADELRDKYGCTCHQCVGGVLSPRMLFELLCASENISDTLLEDIPQMYDQRKNEGGPHDPAFYHHHLEYVPIALRMERRNNKSFKLGFAKTVSHIAACLRDQKPPTVNAILQMIRNTSEWPPYTKNYLDCGGRVEYALDCVLDRSKDDNFIHGVGDHWQIFKEEIKVLPKCIHDDDFDLVRCILLSSASGASVKVSGPYENLDGLPEISEELVETSRKIFEDVEKFFRGMSTEEKERFDREVFGFTEEEP